MVSELDSHQESCQNKNSILRKRIAIAIFLLTVLCIPAFILIQKSSKSQSSISPEINKKSFVTSHGKYTKAAVATELGICSTIGKNILLEGGSAVDAAIASLLCVGVINNFSSGIGGGGFFLIRLPNGTSTVIDFRETAPHASYKEMFENNPTAITTGPLAIAIPGEIKGFSEAHKRFGKLSWKSLFLPSIQLARDGFRVPAELAYRLQVLAKISNGITKQFQTVILENEGLEKTYSKNGSIFQEGDFMKRENLATTLEMIANDGPETFYNGKLAKTLVKNLRKVGAIITLKDFNSYNVAIRNPLERFYRGRKIIATGIPTSGAVALEILGILEYFNMEHDSYNTAHIMIEAFKHGYSSRSMLGDPVHPYKLKLFDFEKKITSKEFIESKAKLISMNQTFPPEYYDVQFEEKDDHGTTHVSVLDPDLMAVAATSTVNLGFGSKYLDYETGILFNDEMDDFSLPAKDNSFVLPPNPNNFIEPGKRPASSSTPLIVLAKNSDTVEAVIGGAGGSRIISATVQTLVNLFDYHMSAAESVHKYRIHHQYKPDFVELEFGIDINLFKHLQSKKHIVKYLQPASHLSSVQLIYRNPMNGMIEAVSDSRKRGSPDGFA